MMTYWSMCRLWTKSEQLVAVIGGAKPGMEIGNVVARKVCDKYGK